MGCDCGQTGHICLNQRVSEWERKSITIAVGAENNLIARLL